MATMLWEAPPKRARLEVAGNGGLLEQNPRGGAPVVSSSSAMETRRLVGQRRQKHKEKLLPVSGENTLSMLESSSVRKGKDDYTRRLDLLKDYASVEGKEWAVDRPSVMDALLVAFLQGTKPATARRCWQPLFTSSPIMASMVT